MGIGPLVPDDAGKVLVFDHGPGGGGPTTLRRWFAVDAARALQLDATRFELVNDDNDDPTIPQFAGEF
jgi:hypothetical protein